MTNPTDTDDSLISNCVNIVWREDLIVASTESIAQVINATRQHDNNKPVANRELVEQVAKELAIYKGGVEVNSITRGYAGTVINLCQQHMSQDNDES